MTKSTDPFKDFTGRDDELRQVTRYSLYKVMIYRTNLYTHSHRVAAIVEAINPTAVKVFGKHYDPEKARLIALVHDDAEIIFGDIQSGNKTKMTPAQLKEIAEAEQQAIETVAKRWPAKLGKYSYKQLLKEAASYETLEAQVACYADKYDALGEALHEIHAGNHHFITHVTNQYGRITIPPEHYFNFFQNFVKKFPKMKKLVQQPLPIFEPVELKEYTATVKKGRLHTADSLKEPVADQVYNTWRQLVTKNVPAEVIKDLHTPKEAM